MDDLDQSPVEIAPATKRKAPSLREKLAAAYCKVVVPLDDGTFVRFFHPLAAQRLSAEEIIERFERWHHWDHHIPLATGGAHHPANLQPLTRHYHQKIKTPKDLADIAKGRRISAAQEEMRRILLAKAGREEKPKPKKKARPMPGTKASGWRHRMSGEWERRGKP